MKLHSKIPVLVVVSAVTTWAQQARSPGTESLPLTAETEIQMGHAIHAENPQVPKRLRGKWVTAVLGATLKADGSFADLTKLGGEDDFEDAAIAAARQWSYTPATLNGVPIATRVFVIIHSDNKHMRTAVEPDIPFSTMPRTPLKEQFASGELDRAIGADVTPPKAIYSPNPDYSDAARAAKYQGAVVLAVIVGREGNVTDTWVVRKLGLGLDQKALGTVQRWKFLPATKHGQPVSVLVNLDVQFRLYSLK